MPSSSDHWYKSPLMFVISFSGYQVKIIKNTHRSKYIDYTYRYYQVPFVFYVKKDYVLYKIRLKSKNKYIRLKHIKLPNLIPFYLQKYLYDST